MLDKSILIFVLVVEFLTAFLSWQMTIHPITFFGLTVPAGFAMLFWRSLFPAIAHGLQSRMRPQAPPPVEDGREANYEPGWRRVN